MRILDNRFALNSRERLYDTLFVFWFWDQSRFFNELSPGHEVSHSVCEKPIKFRNPDCVKIFSNFDHKFSYEE